MNGTLLQHNLPHVVKDFHQAEVERRRQDSSIDSYLSVNDLSRAKDSLKVDSTAPHLARSRTRNLQKVCYIPNCLSRYSSSQRTSNAQTHR